MPADPAFGVTFVEALTLIYAGLAVFVLDTTAIQLTFTRLENLRDQSARADEEFVFAFLRGERSAAIALEHGWNVAPDIINAETPERPPFPFV